MIIEMIAAAGWAANITLVFAYYKLHSQNKHLLMLLEGILEDKIKVMMVNYDEEALDE